MTDTTTNLFVYGTLMPTGWNHRLIEQHVHHALPGTIKGILVSLGTIPALIRGDGLVRGVLLTVDHAALEITDRLEGVPHFYRRLEIAVTLNNGNMVTAWTYEYAEPERLVSRPHLAVEIEGNTPIHAWCPLDCRG